MKKARRNVWKLRSRQKPSIVRKRASELGGLADVVKEEKWDEAGDGRLEGLLEVVKGEEMQERIRKLVKEKIKGVADTAADIFLRRVQGCNG